MSRIVRSAGTTVIGSTLAEAGKIKTGEKVPFKDKTGKDSERPTSLDYFRPTGPYSEVFKKQFGDKPTKLTVVFISDDIAEVCNERWECWEGGKRWGWGDGQNFHIYDMSKKDYVQVTKDSPLLKGRKWDEMLTLRFILPELKGILGYWSYSTKGAKTIIPSLVKSFDFVRERVGTVVGIPWEIHVEKAKGYSPGEARNYSRVKIIPVITPETVQKLRDYLKAGHAISDIAPLMITESKVLAIGEGTPEKGAPTVTVEPAKTPTTLFDEGK